MSEEVTLLPQRSPPGVRSRPPRALPGLGPALRTPLAAGGASPSAQNEAKQPCAWLQGPTELAWPTAPHKTCGHSTCGQKPLRPGARITPDASRPLPLVRREAEAGVVGHSGTQGPPAATA